MYEIFLINFINNIKKLRKSFFDEEIELAQEYVFLCPFLELVFTNWRISFYEIFRTQFLIYMEIYVTSVIY